MPDDAVARERAGTRLWTAVGAWAALFLLGAAAGWAAGGVQGWGWLALFGLPTIFAWFVTRD